MSYGREIKFRGQRNNGEWVYGDLITGLDRRWILSSEEPLSQRIEVIPESIGQFTGLSDKHDKEIYEGDVVVINDDYEKTRHQVKYYGEDGYPSFDLEPSLDVDSNGLSHAIAEGEIIVIGNIYENPNLLEDKQ